MPPDVINLSGKVLKKKSLEDKCCHILHFLSSHISVLPQISGNGISLFLFCSRGLS